MTLCMQFLFWIRIWGRPCKDFLPGYWCSKGILERCFQGASRVLPRCFQGASMLKNVVLQSMINCERTAEDLQVHRRIHKALPEPPGPNAANKMNTKSTKSYQMFNQTTSGPGVRPHLLMHPCSTLGIVPCLCHVNSCSLLWNSASLCPQALHTVWSTWEVYREKKKNYGNGNIEQSHSSRARLFNQKSSLFQ